LSKKLLKSTIKFVNYFIVIFATLDLMSDAVYNSY